MKEKNDKPIKTWVWVMLLGIGCIFAALIVVLLVEMLDLSFLKEAESGPEMKSLASDESVIDESADSRPPISVTKAPAIVQTENSVLREARNLVNNPSFERDPLMTPPNWQTTGLGPGHIAQWTDEQSATGRHALKISADQPSGQGWPGWTLLLTHRPGSGYRLEAKYYTPDGANAWLELAFLDGNRRLLKGFSTGCPRQSVIAKWTAVQHRVNPEWIPPESRSLRIGLRQCLNHSKGRRTVLYFDDVVLQTLAGDD